MNSGAPIASVKASFLKRIQHRKQTLLLFFSEWQTIDVERSSSQDQLSKPSWTVWRSIHQPKCYYFHWHHLRFKYTIPIFHGVCWRWWNVSRTFRSTRNNYRLFVEEKVWSKVDLSEYSQPSSFSSWFFDFVVLNWLNELLVHQIHFFIILNS